MWAECPVGFHCPSVVGGVHRDSAGEKKIVCLCRQCHHIYKHILVSFDVMTI